MASRVRDRSRALAWALAYVSHGCKLAPFGNDVVGWDSGLIVTSEELNKSRNGKLRRNGIMF